MGAVWVRTRAELRSSWRIWLALALLIGLAGGVAIAAVAGARRTATAYPRFVASSNSPDIETGDFPDGSDPEQVMREIARLPSVLAWARFDAVATGFVLPNGMRVVNPQLLGVSDLRGRFFTQIGRAKVLEGRMFDPKAKAEAVVDFAVAQAQGIHVGDALRTYLGDPNAERARTVPVRVVGIVAFARVFPAFGSNNVVGTIELSPAFAPGYGVHPDPGLASLELRLKGGAAGVPTFLAQVRRIGLGRVDFPYVQTTRTAGVQRSTRLEAGAFWVLAAVVLLAAGAVLGQAVSRQTYLSSGGFPILRALGMSRRELFGLGLLRAAIVGAAGAAVALIASFALSPFTPIGLARVAEPNPGFDVDPTPFVLGAVAVLSITVLLAALPAWRATRLAVPSSDVVTAQPSRLGEAATKASRSPVAGIGVRMALESGRGSTSVPVRSAILGATLAVATLLASLMFWSSLQRLVSTPKLSGYTWDLLTAGPTDGEGNPIPGSEQRIEQVLRADRDVAGYSRGAVGVALRLGRRSVFVEVTDGTGPAAPIVVAGRAPSSGNEIALGRASMREEGVAIGDQVRVAVTLGAQPLPPRTMRVVGEVIIPTATFAEVNAGEGAFLTLAGASRLVGQPFLEDGLPYLIRFRDGVDAQAAFERLGPRLPAGSYNVPSQKRGDIATLGRITRVPLALALLLGVIALATLAQTLVTSVRARRRDLAILKTLGFSRRQVRGVVAWQATTLVAVALAIGIPLGLVVGRWVWRTFADGIAVVPSAVVNGAWILLAIIATLLLANLIAAIPARTAARTKPAVVLRSE